MGLKQAFAIIVLCIFSFSCEKEQSPSYAKAKEYYPLKAGNVWFYRLDSVVTINFGTALATHSYHLKDSTGVFFVDNENRESFPVYRFITDTLEQNPWQNISTYYITPTANNIEVVDDNNLRFTKLVSPVNEGIHWQGNSYIDTRSGITPFQYLDGWNYMYANVNKPDTLAASVFDSTVTVLQRDETSPEGPFDPQFYQQRNYSVEIYAHGIGLIYKNFLHTTWQPTPAPARYEDGSYGIVLNLIRFKH